MKSADIIFEKPLVGFPAYFQKTMTYLEVKTPLQHLQIKYPDYIKTNKATLFSLFQI